MIVIRPITLQDEEAYVKLAFSANVGIRGLPKNRSRLRKRLENSIKSFSTSEPQNHCEPFTFVLEDLANHTIGGTCGIISKAGITDPIFFYIIVKEKHESEKIPLKEMPILVPACYHAAHSEICALFLTPEFREGGLGRLLSLSRFLFIASHPKRFTNSIFAEMRGLIDKNNYAPFWEGLGRQFVDIDFLTIMQRIDDGEKFLPEILPKHPIYIPLLKQETQDSINNLHPETQPAYNMLVEEGFHLTQEIDVYDGGPKIESEMANIRTIKESHIAELTAMTSEPIESPKFLISNTKLDFRACLGNVKKSYNHGIILPKEIADALKVNIGDTIRYVSPSSKKESPIYQERAS